ncbi:MAG: hypothetical protein HYY00_07845 [Chloroflexi bacterium]|nr:hypothetical protein [Chloroflexota bacterium]
MQKAAARFLADTASSDEHRWLRDIVEAVCRIEPETLRRLSGGATPQLVGIVVGICLERLRSGYYDSPLYCFTNGEGDVIEDDGDPPRTTWQTAQEAELARQAWTSTWGGRECGYVYRLATP